MAATILTPVTLACTNAFQDVTAAPASGKVRTYSIRACNVTAADATVDLLLTNGTTSINRAKSYPVPFQAAGSAPDLELQVVIPSGWKFQAKSTASSLVEVSATGVEADATDFT